MRAANRSGAGLCILIGGRELEQNEVTLKDMSDGRQWSAPRAEAAAATLAAMRGDDGANADS
jgi:histidyl-tRNA synthetase